MEANRHNDEDSAHPEPSSLIDNIESSVSNLDETATINQIPSLTGNLMRQRSEYRPGHLPQGVRGLVYSYLKLEEIMSKIALLSKREREFLRGNKLLSWQPDGINMERYYQGLM